MSDKSFSEHPCLLCEHKVYASPDQETWGIEWNRGFIHFHCAYNLFNAIRRVKGKKEIHELEDELTNLKERKPSYGEVVQMLTIEEAENEKLREASQGLVNNLPELEIECAREAWGNTNTDVILHWRNEVIKALQGGDDVA